MNLPKSIINLSDKLSNLPGIGPKASRRIALYLSISNKKLAKSLSESIEDSLSKITLCNRCFNVSEDTLCNICQDESRNENILMVVENALDLYAIEEAGQFKGIYHVLNGVISPVNGVGPEDIKLSELLDRLSKEGFTEIIMGLNPNIEGDSTSLYIKSEIEANFGTEKVKITKLAKGIPVGSNIEFASSQTIGDSLSSRLSL